jgi:hypothetical protein
MHPWLRFNEYGVLPPGIHQADWNSMVELLGFNQARRVMIQEGLCPFLRALKPLPVGDIFVDGSFATAKPLPGDIDGYVLARFQDEVACYLEDTREAFKKHLRIDFYPALTDFEGMGSEEYFRDVFRATSDSPPRLKGYLSVADWRAHV